MKFVARIAIFALIISVFSGAYAQPADEAPPTPTPAPAVDGRASNEIDSPAKPTTVPEKEKPKKFQVQKGLSFWDFTKISAEESGWSFPSTTVASTKNGVIYRQRGKLETGPIHNNVSFKANPKQKVRVILAVHVRENGEVKRVQPKVVQLFWARADDVKASGGKWSFSKDRVINLKPIKEGLGIWTGETYYKHWKGEVSRLFVNPVIDGYENGELPPGTEIEFLVERISIE